MVKLHDQTLRDAHQSLLATRMRTEHMLPILEKMDQVGYFSMEVWGGATFDVPIRYLNEDPWDRLKAIKSHVKHTPLQMLERAMNIVAYSNFPDDVVKEFIHYAHKDGISNFRIFDALNDRRNLKGPIEAVKAEGAHAQGCVSYTISPVHTTQFFIELFKDLQKMGCDSLAVKDMSGILTPQAAVALVTGSKSGGVKIPIDIHTHCTSGLAMMTYLKAIEAGADIVDTNISSISGGTGQPPAESMVAALKGTQWDTGYDLKLMNEIRDYFLDIWNKYQHLHNIDNLLYDPSVTFHQIPGGMLSNYRNQLLQQKAADKFPLLIKEIPIVREELGYPPLVTPTSQIVGYQAFLNVMFGRYKNIAKETKDYVKGMYGKPPADISPKIYETILGPNWRDEVITQRPADLLEPRMKLAKEELQAQGLLKKPEDALTYVLYPQVGLKFLKGEAKAEFTGADLPIRKIASDIPSAPQPKKFPMNYRIKVNNVEHEVVQSSETSITVNGKDYTVSLSGGVSGAAVVQAAAAPGSQVSEIVKAPILGNILKIKVTVGQVVKKGQVIATLEAMKMENDILAPRDGTITAISIREGQEVAEGVPMFTMG
ncbi:MAG: pyruvate carboxylase subunit B [Thermoplasmata archaeon]|nr:pyruvate carboxylase subunit B [Thermoplasmata archaeon]